MKRLIRLQDRWLQRLRYVRSDAIVGLFHEAHPNLWHHGGYSEDTVAAIKIDWAFGRAHGTWALEFTEGAACDKMLAKLLAATGGTDAAIKPARTRARRRPGGRGRGDR